METNGQSRALEELHAAVAAVCTPEGSEWLRGALDRLRHTDTLLDDLDLLCARAGRCLGRAPLGAGDTPASSGSLDVRRWEAGDAGRVVMLLAAVGRDPGATERIIRHVYRSGDDGEKAALIRGLSLYGRPEAVKPVALDAGRTNNVALFASLAAGNPFPAAHYDEHEFNQLVLKALFLGVNIAAVECLDKRANARLSRMCEDYYDERTAAGRGVPRDIWLALAPCASDRGRALALKYLTDADAGQRYYAAAGLARNGDLTAQERRIIRDRAGEEPDERVRAALAGINSPKRAGRSSQ